MTADTFYKRTLEGLAEAERNGVHVRPYVLPSLNLYMEAVEKIAPLTEKIHAIANSIEMVKRFMDIPGIGPVTALSFYAAVDNPQRFQKSSDVAAYFGLTLGSSSREKRTSWAAYPGVAIQRPAVFL
ncbi:IS110 family transposase [Ochrobactrum haematophilum]|uniref:IS110 family transposase n=1 Tax=Brucella haematophila TaxID=419474 RepID=A0ABX1DR52_9HYPH|nr:IS110 family transposase [Brucella haematophila]